MNKLIDRHQTSINQTNYYGLIVLLALYVLGNTVGVDIPILSSILMVVQPVFATVLVLISNFKYKKLTAIIVAAFLFFSFIAYGFNGSGYGNLLTWIAFALVMLNVSEVVLSKKQAQKIYGFICVGILFILIYYYKREGAYYISPQGNELNPNVYAMLVYFLGVFFLAWGTQMFKSRKSKMVYVIGICLILYLIFKTGARTSLGAYIIVLFLCFLFRKTVFLQSHKTFCFMNVFLMIAGIVLPIIYIKASEYFNGEIIILGKNIFSGREDIWKEYFEIFKKNIFLGFSNKHVFVGHFTNVHNTYLALLGNAGIISYILWGIILCLTPYVKTLYIKEIAPLYAGWYGVLFIGLFESIWQASMIYIFIAFLCLNKIKMNTE